MPASASECDYIKGKITSISPATPVSIGESLVINGYGFGERNLISSQYDRGVGNVYLKNGQNYAGGEFWDNGITSWTDTRIEVSIPGGFENNFYKSDTANDSGFFNPLTDKLIPHITIRPNNDPSKGYTLCADPISSVYFLYNPSCNSDTWTCNDWSACSIEGRQSRTCNKTFDCRFGDTPSPIITQSCTYTSPVCNEDSWECSNWDTCSTNGKQIRTCNKISNCEGGVSSPTVTQSCAYIPSCSLSDWSCGSWSSCSLNGASTRTCNKTSNCQGGVQSPEVTQSCTHTSSCVSFTYSDLSGCSADGKQTRSVISKYPANCEGGESPKVTLPCIPTPPSIDPGATNRCDQITKNIKYWMDLDLSTINPEGLPFSPSQISSMWESRHKTVAAALKSLLDLTKSYQCGSETKCTQDTWQCGSWGTCSPQGIQTRDCSKTFDCSSIETSSPATSQYCVAPNQPKQQTPTEDLGIVNQNSIIKSTVKLICPVNSTTASQGSGTVIDSQGTILTNKHVIEGTQGCLVGFINNYSDEPYFGEREIADIYKISSDSDIAILKMRNTSNINLPFINISNNNSNLLGLGDKITTYGYPASFGTTITYTSGDFSGIDGNYLKTTAIIEHGNSGGGAYLKDGTFIGIPTAVIKGSLNSMGYLLSVNKVNSWINGSSYVSNSGNSNNYSSVSSILENIDLNTLNSLNLYVANNDSSNTDKKNLTIRVDKNLSKKMSGKILLQVENHGEAYYVNPKTLEKHYMADGNSAYDVMRKLGVGITNKDLTKIQANKILAKNNAGKIFLQVESKGEAYYIDFNGIAHYLKNGAAAYEIMRSLGLGITNDNLNKISEGSL